MFEVADVVWYNGEICPRERANPSVASYSLHLGIGVFDGIRAFWNGDRYYIHELGAHIDRMRHNAKTLEMDVPYSKADLETGIWALLEKIPPADYYLRPLVYRSQPRITVTGRHQMTVDVAMMAAIAPRGVIKPIRCHISPIERVSSRAIPIQVKIFGTYVNSYLVRLAAEAEGFDEGIMLDRSGRIAEAAAANLFFIQGEKTVVTPALTPDIFPGITRSTLIELAPSLGIQVIERDIYPQELGRFEAVFSCATMSELKPLVLINDYQYDSLNHPVFKTFLQEYRQIINQ